MHLNNSKLGPSWERYIPFVIDWNEISVNAKTFLPHVWKPWEEIFKGHYSCLEDMEKIMAAKDEDIISKHIEIASREGSLVTGWFDRVYIQNISILRNIKRVLN